MAFGGRGGGTETTMSPSGETRQDKRRVAAVPMKRFSANSGGCRCCAPESTFTRHSPHVPFPPQAVSTMMPAARALAKTVEPSSQSTVTSAGLNRIFGTLGLNLAGSPSARSPHFVAKSSGAFHGF